MVSVLVSLLVGVVLTILVSRYYFNRSLKHRLAIYVHSTSRVFVGVGRDVRESLTVLFQGHEVDDLGEIVLLVANEGVHPIRDVVRPLVASVPSETELLDATVLHVHPEGRSVETIRVKSAVECRFDLLNPGDYFLLKFLVNGPANASDITFAITAVGIPPRLQASPRAYSTAKNSKFADMGLTFVGLLFLVAAVSLGAGLMLLKDARPELLPFSGFEWSMGAVATTCGALLALIVTLGLGLIGTMMTVAGLFGGSFPPQRTFTLPEHLRHYGRPHFYVGHFDEDAHP